MSQTMSIRLTAMAAVLGLASVCFGPTATARPADDTISIPVSLADLDLGGRAGAQAALHRIEGAAKEICGDEPMSRDFARFQVWQRCVASTTDRAVARLGNPMVTAVRRGDPLPDALASTR